MLHFVPSSSLLSPSRTTLVLQLDQKINPIISQFFILQWSFLNSKHQSSFCTIFFSFLLRILNIERKVFLVCNMLVVYPTQMHGIYSLTQVPNQSGTNIKMFMCIICNVPLHQTHVLKQSIPKFFKTILKFRIIVYFISLNNYYCVQRHSKTIVKLS